MSVFGSEVNSSAGARDQRHGVILKESRTPYIALDWLLIVTTASRCIPVTSVTLLPNSCWKVVDGVSQPWETHQIASVFEWFRSGDVDLGRK